MGTRDTKVSQTQSICVSKQRTKVDEVVAGNCSKEVTKCSNQRPNLEKYKAAGNWQ